MDTNQIARRYLSRSEAAVYLGVCVRTLDCFVTDAGLTHIRLGRRVMFDRESLDQFMSSRRQECTNAPDAATTTRPYLPGRDTSRQKTARLELNKVADKLSVN